MRFTRHSTTQGHTHNSLHILLYSAIPATLLSWSGSAAAAAGGSQAGFWELLIAIFVCGVAASVAYLCYFAVRLWSGYWKALALAPLAVLGVWLAFLLTVIVTDLAPRPLWTVEILFWAMATTVYLVVLFTARRTFEKSAGPQTRPSESQQERHRH